MMIGMFQRLSARDGFWWLLILAMCVVLGAGAFVLSHLMHPPFNFRIYEHFAEYHAAHGRYPAPGTDAQGPIAASYHDYSPFAGLVYRVLFATPHAMHQLVFSVYQIAMLAIGLLCMLGLVRRGRVAPIELLAVIVFFTANPPLVVMLLADDKTMFFTLPMAAILVYETFGLVALGVMIGLFAGWAGLGVGAIPLPLAARDKATKQRLVAFALAVLVTILTFSVEGRDLMGSLANRAARENGLPQWYSIWRLLPGGDNPLLREAVSAAYILLILSLTWLRRIPLIPAFVAVSATYVLWSSSTAPQRVMFFVPVLMLCFATTRTRLAYLVASAAFMFLNYLLFLHLGLHHEEPTPLALLSVLVCNLPLLIPIASVLWRARLPPAATAGDYYGLEARSGTLAER